ncbi:hypothetical protein ACP4OV_003998 [Aristida adscensionis]
MDLSVVPGTSSSAPTSSSSSSMAGGGHGLLRAWSARAGVGREVDGLAAVIDETKLVLDEACRRVGTRRCRTGRCRCLFLGELRDDR